MNRDSASQVYQVSSGWLRWWGVEVYIDGLHRDWMPASYLKSIQDIFRPAHESFVRIWIRIVLYKNEENGNRLVDCLKGKKAMKSFTICFLNRFGSD